MGRSSANPQALLYITGGCCVPHWCSLIGAALQKGSVSFHIPSDMLLLSRQEREGFRIWDFCSLECLVDARQMLRAWDRGDAEPASTQLHAELAMAIAAAVNCSSRARHTPLHLAAIEGSSPEVKVCHSVILSQC